ncbi:VOC family protein [Priestia megaterium]|uniref:VOC family protein n=1 Tax=Priestia megaterium TaxID=1404 RepID=UPI0027316346|nr:VOC family protein [Priestia megaterium]MDP1471834.1 VOC family protein [Priestia megaterium]
MNLNHLNLCVNDLYKAREFFETYFDFKFLEQKGKALIVMCDSEDFILVLSDPTAFKGGKYEPYPKAFHFGFLVDSQNQVDEVYNRLIEGGIQVEKKPYKMRGSSYGFYFVALDELLIEVSCIDYKDGKKVLNK